MVKPMNLIKATCLAIPIAGFSVTASAAKYDFFQDTEWTAGALQFNGALGTLEVSARNDGSATSYIRADGNAGGTRAYGLTVCSGGASPIAKAGWDCGNGSDTYGDVHWIDAGDQTESVVLNFEGPVTLDSASFTDGLWGTNAAFDLWIDGVLTLEGESVMNTVDFSGLVGSEFEFRSAGGNQDFFKMAAVEVAEVPLPASAWLFITAIGGLLTTQRLTRSKASASK